MKAKFGPGVNDLSELDSATYEAIMLWASGVKKAGSIEQAKVIAALESGITIEGPSGNVYMDPQLHTTVRNAYLATPKIANGIFCELFLDQRPDRYRCAMRSRQKSAHRDPVHPLHLKLETGYGFGGASHLQCPGRHRNAGADHARSWVIYGMMRIINLAHGEFMMLGAYTTVSAVGPGVNIWIAMLVSATLVVGPCRPDS